MRHHRPIVLMLLAAGSCDSAGPTRVDAAVPDAAPPDGPPLVSTAQPAALPTEDLLFDVWGSGAGDVWAVGTGADTGAVIYHLQAGVWTRAEARAAVFYAVWGSGPARVI